MFCLVQNHGRILIYIWDTTKGDSQSIQNGAGGLTNPVDQGEDSCVWRCVVGVCGLVNRRPAGTLLLWGVPITCGNRETHQTTGQSSSLQFSTQTKSRAGTINRCITNGEMILRFAWRFFLDSEVSFEQQVALHASETDVLCSFTNPYTHSNLK